MVNIELTEHSADDVKAIQMLKKLGFSDEEIQAIYDKSYKSNNCVKEKLRR